MTQSPLPIDEVLGALRSALAQEKVAVLVAPPGAGKTTRAPLSLLDEPWMRGRKLVMLEPRRLAARAAASRMAQTLGESVGQIIGLRVRLETRVSRSTRIEIVTEGVFTRMIVDDPGLDGVAGVIFDEFHERSLDADLGLALTLEARAALRDDLRLLIMSATLDGAQIGRILAAPLIESQGRAFPVETVYLGRDPNERVEEAMARAIAEALAAETGSILAFLPGRAEIERTAERLRAHLPEDVELAPLHGSLDREGQDRAVRPAAAGCRKVVLATSIAETSLTIEGVRVVVDSGLARAPRFEPALGLTRLETVRASRASVDQRRGRAGRTGPGVCFRLWDAAGAKALPAFPTPEIREADLSGLALHLAAWGAREAASLAWLDPPPPAALTEARRLLARLGALDAAGALTDVGRAMRDLPLPPRLARMVVMGARTGEARLAAEIAVVVAERGLVTPDIDVAERVRRLRREGGARDGRRLAQAWAQAGGAQSSEATPVERCGALLALAYPDRIAKARGGRSGGFLMANGRAASLDPAEPLARETWLAVAEVAGRAGGQRILAAAALAPEAALAAAGDALETQDETWFDKAEGALRRRIVTRLGAVVVAERFLPPAAGPKAAAMLVRGVAELGLDRLPWTPRLQQWRDRVMFLRAVEGEEWPDLSEATLVGAAQDWLAPAIEACSSVEAIAAADLEAALKGLLDWRLAARLEQDAPAEFVSPAGSSLPIDYGADGGPALRVRVQELFGLAVHPTLAAGRASLVLHLLSPARRPIQITRNLPGFWKGSWAQVAAEMRGRYPKHPWPDDPLRAPPTTRAKPRN